MCAGNELFFVALYVMHAYTTPLGLDSLLRHLSPTILAHLPPPIFKALALLTWPQVVAAVTFPIMFVKQVINCVQFWKASKVLVESDQEERWEKQHKKGQ